MARKGVTYEQVCEAIDRLTAKGAKITNATIRGELGTGSTSTILEHFNKWKASQPPQETQDKPEQRALADVVALINKKIDAEIATEVQRRQEFEEETNATINGLHIEANNLQEALDAAYERIEALIAERGELQGRIAALEEQHAALQKRTEAAEARAEAAETQAQAQVREAQERANKAVERAFAAYEQRAGNQDETPKGNQDATTTETKPKKPRNNKRGEPESMQLPMQAKQPG